jgi:outer membrane receptor protein involved in Fe transport
MQAWRKSALLGSISILAFAGSAAAAANDIEEVVVTATKRTEELKNIPMSITVIGQAQLDRLNARSFEDFATTVPGLSVTEADPTHPDLILRGINAGGDGSTVGTYIDETPFGSSNALSNGSITAPNLDTYDMARIEVLRGPQGTLYGASSEGGLLRFVTNAPDPSGFDDSFELGAFDLDRGGADGSARGMVNVPLSDDLAIRGVGYYQRTPGYIDNLALGAKNTNHLVSDGGRLSLLYQPTSKLSIRLNAMVQKINAGDIDAEDVVLTPTSFYPKYGDYNERRTANELDGVRYYLYNGTLDWDLDWATFTSSTSFGVFHDYSLLDDTAAFGADVQGFLHQGKFTQEFRLASDPGDGPFEWLAGVYYTNETSSIFQGIVTGFHGPLIFPGATLQLDSNYNEIAGFANATYHISPAFEVGFGGRYSANSQHAFEFSPALLPGPQRGSSSQGEFTWSADARYHLSDQTMFYARVATGFRPGGPNVIPIGAPKGVPPSYNADSLTDYELGVKSTWLDENLSFDADVYLINWKNIQLLETFANTNVNGNGGTARSQGAEADITWTPVERLNLNLNGAYTDAYLTENTDLQIVGGRDGNPLPWSPKWSASLSGDYDFLPIGDWAPYVGATWHLIGTRYSDYIGSLFAPPGVGSQYAIPSYNTLDLRAGVNWGKWSVEIYAKNLNDAKGITAFSSSGGSVASDAAANVAVIQPRLIGIVLRGKL